MGRRKKVKSVEDLSNFANGKDEDIERTKKIEEIIGLKAVNPFGTNDPKIFEQTLTEANLADLQRMCEKVGIFPSYEKARLKAALKKEFMSIVKGRSITMETPAGVFDPNHPDHEKAKKLFREGF